MHVLLQDSSHEGGNRGRARSGGARGGRQGEAGAQQCGAGGVRVPFSVVSDDAATFGAIPEDVWAALAVMKRLVRVVVNGV